MLGQVVNGAGEPVASTLPATTTTSTTIPGAPPLPSAAPIDRTAADADEPLCSTSRGPTDVDPAEDRAAADALLPMMSVVNTYGVPLGEEFHGAGQSWNGDGERIVVASFVANVAEHRRALTDLVDDPDHLLVCRARLTQSEAATISTEITPLLVDVEWASDPTGLDGRLDVDLRAGRETLAATLWETYGDQVAITVGVFSYPLPEPLPEPICPELPDLHPELRYVADDPEPVVLAADESFETNVDVPFTNISSQRIDLTTGVPRPVLVDAASGDVVGVPGGIAGFLAVGIIVDLDPGEQHEQAVSVPTASCDPALGHTLAPGDYHLFAINSSDRTDRDFAVGPVPVTITD